MKKKPRYEEDPMIDDRQLGILAVVILAIFVFTIFLYLKPQPKQDLSCYDLIFKAEGGMAELWRTNQTGIIYCVRELFTGTCDCRFNLGEGTVIYKTKDLMPKWDYYEKDGG